MTPDILQLAASGDATNVLRDMRVRSLYSPYYFVKVVLGYGQLSADFHLPEMENFVSNWSRGVRKQAIEWARGFYKTTCFTIGTSMWVVLPWTDEDTEYATHHLGFGEGDWLLRMGLHDQDATQLLAFETSDNAEKKVGIIKWQFEENALFRRLFPEIAHTGKENPWNTSCLKIRRVGKRRADAEGTFEAIGVGGALQSRHYKIVWEDDLVGEKARKSPAVMEQTIGWHGRLHGCFENATEQIRFLVSNRWGYADLNSAVRAGESDFVFHTRSAIEIGEGGREVACFPEQYPLEKLLAIRDSGNMTRYDFSCQYLNDPTLPGQKELNTSFLHYYTVEEDGKVVCDECGVLGYLSQMNRYLQYDPYNDKGKGSKSCPALGVVATTSSEKVLVVDYWMNKGHYDKVFDRIYWFNDTYRPIHMTYEDVGHQNADAFHIREISKTADWRAKHKPFPRIIPVTTGNVNKNTRIREALTVRLERGKLHVRKTQTVLVDMLDKFPNPCLDHDYDLLDMLAQGHMHWHYPESQDAAVQERNDEEAYLAKLGQNYCAGVEA